MAELTPDQASKVSARIGREVEAWLRDGRPVVSTFVELEPPPVPEGYLPASIFEALEQVRALSVPASRVAQVEQQRRERKGETLRGTKSV